MPTVRHPRALADVAGHPPARVSVAGTTYAVDRDGDDATVELPESAVATLARAYGVTPDDLRVTARCQTVKSDGDVCGRELPCAYHSGGEN